MEHYHSIVDTKYKFLTLFEFIRTRYNKNKIVVLCPGAHTPEFLRFYFYSHDIMSISITGKTSADERKNNIVKFLDRNVKLNVAFVSQGIADRLDITGTDWCVEYAVPPTPDSYIKLISSIKAAKNIIFVDGEYEKDYITRLVENGLESKEIPFDVHKIPKNIDKMEKLLKKNYQFYYNSEYGYRELINSYVYSDNPEFDSHKLRLTEASICYGIRHPPKLPLDRPE